MTKLKKKLPYITKQKHKTPSQVKSRKVKSRKLSKSYNSYINNITGESLTTNTKRVWSFIKQTQRENLGIPSLNSNDKMQNTDHDKANTK